MPTATHTHITPTRRSVIAAFSAAAITRPTKAATSPDAAIIATVNRLLANAADMDRLSDQRLTIAAERATQAQMDVLVDQGNEIADCLEELGRPTTLAGVKAMARAALRFHPAYCDGDVEAGEDLTDWLTVTVMQALAEVCQ